MDSRVQVLSRREGRGVRGLKRGLVVLVIGCAAVACVSLFGAHNNLKSTATGGRVSVRSVPMAKDSVRNFGFARRDAFGLGETAFNRRSHSTAFNRRRSHSHTHTYTPRSGTISPPDEDIARDSLYGFTGQSEVAELEVEVAQSEPSAHYSRLTDMARRLEEGETRDSLHGFTGQSGAMKSEISLPEVAVKPKPVQFEVTQSGAISLEEGLTRDSIHGFIGRSEVVQSEAAAQSGVAQSEVTQPELLQLEVPKPQVNMARMMVEEEEARDSVRGFTGQSEVVLSEVVQSESSVRHARNFAMAQAMEEGDARDSVRGFSSQSELAQVVQLEVAQPEVAAQSEALLQSEGLQSEAGPESDVDVFDWNKQWYPIAVEEIVDRTKPHQIKLLGTNLVLWHNGEEWSVFRDECPHRHVPLSEGRVEENGELLCAYHGWRFDSKGDCKSIPQSSSAEREEQLTSNPASCAKVHPTQVEHGMIWAWGEPAAPGSDSALIAATKQPQLVEEIDDPELKDKIVVLPLNSRDMPYGWDYFMENVNDPAHVVVSHHNVVGNRYTDPTHIKMPTRKSLTEIPVEEGGSYNPNFPGDKGLSTFVENSNALGGDTEVSYQDFRPPCLHKIVTKNKDGSELILALYATPTEPGFCRHIGRQILIKNKKNKLPKGLAFFAAPMPKWLLHILASAFLHQDAVFLHHQERMKMKQNYAFGRFPDSDPRSQQLKNDVSTYAKGMFVPDGHDKALLRFRRWLGREGQGGPLWGPDIPATLPDVLPPDQLFDVYNSHVKDCRMCLTALKNIKRVKLLAIALAAGLGTAARFSKPWMVAGAAASAMVAFVSHNLMKLFHKYEFSHQANA